MRPRCTTTDTGGRSAAAYDPAMPPSGTLGRRTVTRRHALRSRLAEQDLDALLVTDLQNIRYLSGFTGSNAALLIAASGDEDSVFCTDCRYLVQAQDEVPDLRAVNGRNSALGLIRAATPGRLGFESHAVSVADHQVHLANAPGGVHLEPTVELVERLRAIKDADEVAAIAAACQIGDAALATFLADGGLRPGRTEREAALDLDQRMRMLGAVDVAFPTILAAGANSAIPHHHPGDAVLCRGDLVKIDFGAVVDGYHSDMTRTFVLGEPADWQREIYQLVAAAQAVGRESVRPGASCKEVDAAARDLIAAAGHAEHFGHGLGHGVGLVIHEPPWLAATGAGIIEGGMTVTVEPGVYLPGRGGVRIEDSGVVGSDGYQPLTLTTRDLTVL
jgi:Xaa-Pro aminopeptidase